MGRPLQQTAQKSALIDLVFNELKVPKEILNRTIDVLANKEKCEFHEASQKVQEEAKEWKNTQLEAEPRRNKKDFEAKLLHCENKLLLCGLISLLRQLTLTLNII